jgi:PLP dependent protein
MEFTELAARVVAVRERIDAALLRAGRSDAVTLVAVTKTYPAETVLAALRAGLTDIGENRVQELEEKVDAVGRSAASWHLIGHLQRNKARRSLALFDLIHSVDSLRLARTLSKEAQLAETTVRALVQVNVSGEETKGGFEGESTLDQIAEVCELPGLRIEGLMTMAPFDADEATLRGVFAAARELRDAAASQHGGVVGRELSMGMSDDFEIAVEEGSTLVRLGSVLFGERQR